MSGVVIRGHSHGPRAHSGFLVNWGFNMAISPDLLEILICPACRAKVELNSDASGLRCVSCHRVYPIRDEIPVMLIDEATIDE